MDGFLKPADPNDTRFQFEIIKGLADSIRQLTTNIADMQRTQVGMLERLAKLEANRVAEVVAEVRADVAKMEIIVTGLTADKNQRDGAVGMLGTIRTWAPFIGMIASILAAAWLYGRSLGITPAPPTQPARVEATIHPEERKIEGFVGGRP